MRVCRCCLRALDGAILTAVDLGASSNHNIRPSPARARATTTDHDDIVSSRSNTSSSSDVLHRQASNGHAGCGIAFEISSVVILLDKNTIPKIHMNKTLFFLQQSGNWDFIGWCNLLRDVFQREPRVCDTSHRTCCAGDSLNTDGCSRVSLRSEPKGRFDTLDYTLDGILNSAVLEGNIGNNIVSTTANAAN